MAKDPVCGMQVDEASAAARVEHEGTTFYFCSTGCRQRFEQDPEQFVLGSRPSWDRP